MRRSQSCWRSMPTGTDDWSAALLDAWREEEQGQPVELVCGAQSGGRWISALCRDAASIGVTGQYGRSAERGALETRQG